MLSETHKDWSSKQSVSISVPIAGRITAIFLFNGYISIRLHRVNVQNVLTLCACLVICVWQRLVGVYSREKKSLVGAW